MHNIIISIKIVYLKSSDVLFFSFRFMIIIYVIQLFRLLVDIFTNAFKLELHFQLSQYLTQLDSQLLSTGLWFGSEQHLSEK